MISIKQSIEIQKLLADKENELANSSIIKICTLMNQIYKTMIQWGELKNNPLDGVETHNQITRKFKHGQKKKLKSF